MLEAILYVLLGLSVFAVIWRRYQELKGERK